MGENSARYCTDGSFYFPWNENAPLRTRLAQFSAAASRLDRSTFRPFSVGGWLAPFPTGALGPDACITWPAPERKVPRPIPRGAGLPRKAPALFINADLDQVAPTAMSAQTAREWRHSHLVEIDNSGHHAATNIKFECAGEMIVSFIEAFSPGDTSCATDHEARFPALGRFPVHAADARKAKVDPGNGDASTAADRRVANAATSAVTDAFRRAFSGQTEAGVGLRGGTFETAFHVDRAANELHGVRFARDVAVSGHAEYLVATEEIDTTVTVDGPGGEDGTLHVTGAWFGFEHETTVLEVRGTLGGRNVAVEVPGD